MKAPTYAIGSKVFFVLVPGRHTSLTNTNIHRLGLNEPVLLEGRVGGVRRFGGTYSYEVFNSLYGGWLTDEYIFPTEKQATELFSFCSEGSLAGLISLLKSVPRDEAIKKIQEIAQDPNQKHLLPELAKDADLYALILESQS